MNTLAMFEEPSQLSNHLVLYYAVPLLICVFALQLCASWIRLTGSASVLTFFWTGWVLIGYLNLAMRQSFNPATRPDPGSVMVPTLAAGVALIWISVAMRKALTGKR